MKVKKETIERTINFIVCIIILLGYFLIADSINQIYKKTNNLIFHLIYFVLVSIPYILILVFLLLRIFSKKTILFFINPTKFLIIGILIIILSGFIVNYSQMMKYNYIKINGKETNMLSYQYAILKDVIIGKTTTVTIPITDIYPKDDKISISRRVRHRRKIKRYYISYIEENGQYKYVTESDEKLNNIIQKLKNINLLTEEEMKITIEYYNNSGIIKTIEGIDIYDYENLNLLLVQKINENKQKEEEKQKLEKEETKKNQQIATTYFKIKQNAVGKNIETIKKELEKNEIFDYSIKYISSKLYSRGVVSFFDNKKNCFYVIKDNKKEDMVRMPEVKAGITTKEEAMDMLNKSGLIGYVYGSSEAYNKEKSGTIKHYTYSPGTLLPKGVEVGFWIYE